MALKPFADTLREIPGTDVLTECSEQMQKLLLAVMETNKGGSLTLKIDVKPIDKGGIAAVMMRPSVSAKLPEEATQAGLFFVTPEGNPSRKHPQQDDLPGVTVVQSNKSAAA